MNIRRANSNDIKEVKELLDQVDMVHHIARPDLFKIGRKYTDEQLYKIFGDDSRPIFVATDENDKTMGYAFCIFQQHVEDNVLTDIKTLYIDDLCVYENLRGQHIGQSLYNYVLEFARNEGCYNVTLNVWNGNPAAQKFYESMGMQVQKLGMETIL
ncbi:MAG: GNAT family N-acetyltransferase [Eubacterium sp.]|nr:GNAT family N-acetyltransferase [Eubacterium sp.]